jgi:hypothetical protein
METAQSPNQDILRNRAELLTTAVKNCNSDLAKVEAALHMYTSERLVYQVKVLNTDSFKEVVDVVFFGVNKELDILVQHRLQEKRLELTNQKNRYSEELTSINLQLSAMGII